MGLSENHSNQARCAEAWVACDGCGENWVSRLLTLATEVMGKHGMRVEATKILPLHGYRQGGQVI